MLCSLYLLFGLLNPRILYCPILFMIIPEVIEYCKTSEINVNGEIY